MEIKIDMLFILFGLIIYIFKDSLLKMVNDYGENQIKIMKIISLYYIFLGITRNIFSKNYFIKTYLFNIITMIIPLLIYLYFDKDRI